jgi:outer membrane protein insertion porin family
MSIKICFSISIPSKLIAVIICGAFCISPVLSQVPGSTQSLQIDKIEFHGNATFDDGALKQVIQSKETPGGFSQFLYRTLGGKLGSKPEYFDPVTFDTDIKRLQEYYEAEGFYHAIIKSASHLDTNNQRINLQFTIDENKRSLVDSIAYRGLENVPVDLREKIFKEQLIGFGMPYVKERAAMEIKRILEILQNTGYPTARFDYDHWKASLYLSSNNFSLVFTFTIGKQYTFGATSVRVDPPREDITDDLSLRQLDFSRGELYSREKISSSESNLIRMGLFESVRIDSSSQRESTSTSTEIPMNVVARPRVRNEVAPELLVSDEQSAFNLGIGLGYTNRNFFGDARTFNTRVRARTQSLRDIFRGYSLKDSAIIGAVDLQFQILQPYLFTRTLSGSWTSEISAEKQNNYILSILRNRMGLTKRFATYTFGTLEWTLERVNPEILLKDTLQQQNILSTLREEDQPQFNSILTATLQRDKTNDPFNPTGGFFHSISLEESGILPKLIQQDRSSGLPFTQYYKVTLLGRWYEDLTTSRYNIFAIKLKTGYQDKYGESRTLPVNIPLNRRFFAGGSNSVRGWRARELGAMPNELIQFGGNFIFEGSAEMRVNHFRRFGKLGFIRLENIWFVYFLDAGNVWSDISDFKPKDIAMAAGMGFRYNTFFGPFRIDYGFQIYDPKGTVGKKSIFQKSFWNESFGSGVFHFGIGHAF